MAAFCLETTKSSQSFFLTCFSSWVCDKNLNFLPYLRNLSWGIPSERCSDFYSRWRLTNCRAPGTSTSRFPRIRSRCWSSNICCGFVRSRSDMGSAISVSRRVLLRCVVSQLEKKRKIMFVKVVFWQIYNFDRLKCCVNQLSKLLFDHYFVDKVLTFRTNFVEFFLVVMLG